MFIRNWTNKINKITKQSSENTEKYLFFFHAAADIFIITISIAINTGYSISHPVNTELCNNTASTSMQPCHYIYNDATLLQHSAPPRLIDEYKSRTQAK